MGGTAVMINPVQDLIDALGRREVMEACQVKTQAITNWITRRRIPARHYPAFRDLCGARGVDLPEHLFFGD